MGDQCDTLYTVNSVNMQLFLLNYRGVTDLHMRHCHKSKKYFIKMCCMGSHASLTFVESGQALNICRVWSKLDDMHVAQAMQLIVIFLCYLGKLLIRAF